MDKTKVCTDCKIEKPIECFRKWRCRCKDCQKIIDKNYRIEHKDHIKQRQKQYNADNRDHLRNKRKEWVKTSNGKKCLHNRYIKRYARCKDKILESNKNWKLNNPEKFKNYITEWLNSPKGKESCARRNYKRRSLIQNTINDLTAQEWLEIQVKQNYKCVYCGEVKPLHRDHIIPISKGGNNTKSNIQGLCQQCNSKKADKIDSLGFVKILQNPEMRSL